ncbi:hypothetical protein MMC14_009527 [Varicellaria rhodocarpa]|nr:hypothetical protein [Varicellaria rhodocarpa]
MAFKEQGIFEDHLESYHKIMTDQPDSEAIVKALKEKDPQVFVDRSCPLCCDTAGDTPMKFAQHVGKHMEAIALAVLPQGSDSDSDSDQHQGDYDTDSNISFAAMAAMLSHSPVLDGNGSLSPTVSLNTARNVIRQRLRGNSYRAPASVAAESGIAALWTKPGGPPILTLVSPVHSELDEDENNKREADGSRIDFALSDRVITPTLDGFMAEIRHSSPHMPLYLCNRLGHEQLRRYKKLLGLKVEHAKAIQRGSCSSGTLCSLKVKGNLIRLPHPAKLIGGEDSGNDIGLFNTSQFPNGVPMAPTEYLSSEFECPLCFRVKRFQKPLDWSKHVLEDLQPFTCTFKACLEPKSFKRMTDWVRHQKERHRVLEWWQCSEEDCNHKCFRRDNFVQHLVREHKMQEPKPVTRLVKPSVRGPTKDRSNFNDGGNDGSPSKVMSMLMTCRYETRSKPSDEPCSFCGNISQSWKRLTVHLARHMEQISTPVLDLVRQVDARPETIVSPIIAPIRHPTSPVDESAISYNDISPFSLFSTSFGPVLPQEEPFSSENSNPNLLGLHSSESKPKPMVANYDQSNKDFDRRYNYAGVS